MSGDGPGTTPLDAVPDDDPTAVLLRRALAAEAHAVRPGTDGLAGIRARTGTLPVVRADRPTHPAAGKPSVAPPQRGWGRLALAAAAVVALGLLGGGALGALLRPDDPQPVAGARATAPVTPPPSAPLVPPSADPAGTQEAPSPTGGRSSATDATGSATVPVYYVAPQETRFALYREFRTTRDRGANRVEDAIRAMLATRPLDPDYGNLWRPATRVSAQVRADGIVVDLSPDAFGGHTAGDTLDNVEFTGAFTALAAMSVQQLVWTATAALGQGGDVPVTVLVDGATGHLAWGTVELGAPMTRAAESRAAIWIIDPAQGQVVRGPGISVAGSGYAFEGTIRWEVAGSNGDVVRAGTVTTRGDGIPGDFGFDADLDPGTYTVTAWAPDESGRLPVQARPDADTKTFVVSP